MRPPVTEIRSHAATTNQAGQQTIKRDLKSRVINNTNNYHFQCVPLDTLGPRLLSSTERSTADSYSAIRMRDCSDDSDGITESLCGIETIGLLLRVLPYFAIAAEHYKKDVEPGSKKELFAPQYEEEITLQRTSLMQYIERVTKRSALSLHSQLALLDEVAGEAWRQSETAKHLSTALGSDYKSLSDIIWTICRTLGKQVKNDVRQDLDEDRTIEQLRSLCPEFYSSPATLELAEPWALIKFSRRSSKRAALLTKIQECNGKLYKLNNTTIHAKSIIEQPKIDSIHTAFEQRRHAQKLFEVLQKACKCVPSGTRDVSLQLQVYVSESENHPVSEFEMLLFISQDVICDLSAKIVKGAPNGRVKKKIRFATADDDTEIPETTSHIRDMTVLEDICTEGTLAHECKACLQLFVDEREEVYFTAQERTCHDRQQPTLQHLSSLTEVMAKLKPFDQKHWLRKEKLILAIILAYSHLQLYDSSWSQQQWNSDDIMFIDDPLTRTSQHHFSTQLQLRRPYTRSNLLQTIRARSTKKVTSSRPPQRNAHLHALGIVLLELYLNQSLHAEATARDTDDYRSVALDLIEDLADEDAMIPEYYKALKFCLFPHPNPETKSFSLEDEGFREIFYQEVILQLKQALRSRYDDKDIAWMRGK